MGAPKNGAGAADSTDPVVEQYEAYPYPPRDPRDEAKGLYITRLSSLPDVNH